MTYSKQIQEALKKAKVTVGDRIAVGSTEGILMPSPEITASPDYIVLKLDNGYNIGIKYDGQPVKATVKQSPHKQDHSYGVFAPAASSGKKHRQPAKQSCESKHHIALLGAGGTITSKIDYSTGGVSTKMTGEDLIAFVPELEDIACFDIKTVLEIMSEDMLPENWALLAKEAAKALDLTDGVIITHGTDTMHYTSAALAFMLETPKPVVLTGAQRSSDRGSTDSPLNMICSAHAALSDIAEVGICMHGTSSDDYCNFIRGTKARKMHSTMRNAFRPINDYPLARIFPDGKIEPTNHYAKRGSGKAKADTKFEEKVALIKVYPGADPKIIDYYVNQDYKGLLLEATALGHVPTKSKNTWIPSICEAVSSGVIVTVATQCIYGTVNPNVYTNLRILFHEAGAVPARDMTPETAYVKLGWVLAHAKAEKAKELMQKNLRGEINERLEPDMFLY